MLPPAAKHVSALVKTMSKHMIKEPETDISELEKLKGIGIGVTADGHWFLILTYREKTIREKVFPWILWSAVAVLYGLAIWWLWP
jgi:hypothetical protein